MHDLIMNLKEKLQIILITYNRKNTLKTTLDEILSENSPIKDLPITILDREYLLVKCWSAYVFL